MKHSLAYKMMGLFLLAVLCLGFAGIQGVQAEGPLQASLTFTDLGMTIPQTLSSPVSEYAMEFNLPANWKPAGTVSLDVNITAFFSSLVAAETSSSLSGLVGGDFSLYLNDVLVGTSTLQESGDQTLHFEFDAALFKAVKKEDVNTLRLRWDGSISCSMNLLSSVSVSPSSTMSFSYSESNEILTLNDFPAPFIVEKSVKPASLILVVPAQPTAGELKAAMILAAGIGQVSKGAAVFEVVSVDEYTPASGQNVFLVTNTDSLNALTSSGLNVTGVSQTAAGEGLLQLFATDTGYKLLVSGDEEGIIKAAQVLAADQIIAGGDGMSMLVSNVNPVQTSTESEDSTLEDLGIGELVFTSPSALTQSFDFFVPAGNQVRSDATFDLVVSHSQQLDYLNSGLQMKVNGYPAVSLRLTDNTSNENLFKLIMPANLIHAGRNTIEFTAALNTRDLCLPATEDVAWLRISSSSLLHLPLESAVGESMLAKKFSDFPAVLLSGTGLNDVVLEVGADDFGNIQAAAKVASSLGAVLPDHSVVQLTTLFSNAAEVGQLADQSIILVGKPSNFVGLTDSSQFPSLVFTAENSLSDQSALEFVSKPESGVDAGYLAIRGFGAASSKVLLAVLGNSSTGITYAVDALTGGSAGDNNFLLDLGSGAQTGWLDNGIATGKISTPATVTTPTAETVNPIQQFRSNMLKWAVPVLAVLLALALWFLYIEIRQGGRKSK